MQNRKAVEECSTDKGGMECKKGLLVKAPVCTGEVANNRYPSLGLSLQMVNVSLPGAVGVQDNAKETMVLHLSQQLASEEQPVTLHVLPRKSKRC